MASQGDELADYIASLDIPDAVQLDINRARTDLYFGPLYLTPDGDEASCFDEGAAPFNFSAACRRIGDALDSVAEDVWLDTFAGCWQTSEPEPYRDEDTGEVIDVDWSDWRHVEAREIVAAIVGRELASYIW